MEGLLALDGGLLLWIQGVLRQDWLTPAVTFFTHLGDHGLLWIGLCVLLLCLPKTRKAGLVGAAALLLSLALTNGVLKNLVGRTRPWLVVEGLTALVDEPDPNSFPSGHTSAAFAAAAAWLKTLPERWMRGTMMTAAVLMGLSRLYVGVHFPSDVVCGAVVGTVCGMLSAILWEQIENKQKGTLD